MAKKLKVWNGASWEDVTFAITPPNANVTNEFSTNQVIDASTSVAALRVTQRGSGEAFRVEDSSTPDSSAFVIDTSGHVYVGSVNAASKIPTTRQYLNVGGLSGTGVLQLLDAGSNSALSGLIEFHDLQNTANVGGTRNAYIAAFVDGTTTANNRGGRLDFATKQGGDSTAATPKMTITNTGLVGIGTTSPDSALHISAGGDTTINLTKTGQSTWYMQSLDSGVFRLYSGTASAERLKIDNSGNVTIGGAGINLTNGKIIINSSTSVTGANWTEAMLHITGINDAASNPGMTFHAPGASAVSIYHVRGWQGVSVLGNAGITDTASGRPVVRNISISTSSPTGGSDGDMWAVYV
jgi:hypothetical protein